MKKFLVSGIVAVSAFALAISVDAAFTRNLSVGSTGTDVAELQSWLISKGYAIPSISSGAAAPGYFGAQTKTAVTAYQAANGIPATGFFGPLTMASVNGGGVAAPSVPAGAMVIPFPCPAGYVAPSPWVCPNSTGSTVAGLAGTDGSISDINTLSQYNNEEVGDGESDVKVLGFEVEASNDGDILLRSIKLVLDPTGNASGDSDHLDDYVEGVTVWQGTTEIGSADVSDFTETSSDVWEKTITLRNAVVRADETEKFYVSVDAVNNFDSGDIDSDSWTIAIANMRFEDGSGVVSTETSAIPTDIDWDAAGDGIGIAFVNFSTAANTELKISTDASSPDAGIVVIDETDDTEDVVLLVGKMKLEGTSDVTIDELPITLTTSGDSVSALTGSLTLEIGGEDYTESVSIAAAQTGSVTFDNLDFTIEAGETVEFTVLADINDTDNTGVTATDFDEGDTLTASLTASNRNMMDVENAEGDQLDTSSERSGTATGDAQEFRTNGIALALVSTATSATEGTSANDDVGLFTIKFKVTAIGDSVYLSSLIGSYTFAVDKGGTATSATSQSGAIVNNTDTDKTSVGNYLIEEGESETFTLSVSVPLSSAGTSGQYRTALTGVLWDTSDDTSPANTYSSNLDSFKTDYQVLN